MKEQKHNRVNTPTVTRHTALWIANQIAVARKNPIYMQEFIAWREEQQQQRKETDNNVVLGVFR